MCVCHFLRLCCEDGLAHQPQRLFGQTQLTEIIVLGGTLAQSNLDCSQGRRDMMRAKPVLQRTPPSACTCVPLRHGRPSNRCKCPLWGPPQEVSTGQQIIVVTYGSKPLQTRFSSFGVRSIHVLCMSRLLRKREEQTEASTHSSRTDKAFLVTCSFGDNSLSLAPFCWLCNRSSNATPTDAVLCHVQHG